MARDVMSVRLHLPQIRVLGVVEDAPGALVVSVESTLRRLRLRRRHRDPHQPSPRDSRHPRPRQRPPAPQRRPSPARAQPHPPTPPHRQRQQHRPHHPTNPPADPSPRRRRSRHSRLGQSRHHLTQTIVMLLRQQRVTDFSDDGEIVLGECLGVGRSGQPPESGERVSEVLVRREPLDQRRPDPVA